MGSHGYELRDLGLHSYPCARLRVGSRETVPAVLFRCRTWFYLHEGITACSSERVTGPVQAIDHVQYRSHTSPRPTIMPADYTQCRVQKRGNECENEKRLVKRQWLGIALTVCGARGTLAVHAAASNARGRTTALPSRDYFYHILPTIRLHGTISDHICFWPGTRAEADHLDQIFCTRDRAWEASFALFLFTAERRLTADRLGRFFVRVIAHGRHISPSFYLPPSKGLPLTVWTDFLYA